MVFYFPIFKKLFDSTEGEIRHICLSESVFFCLTWWSSVLSVSPKCYNFLLLYGWIIILPCISTSHSYLSICPPLSDREAVFSSLLLTFLKWDQERTGVMKLKISRHVPEWMLCLHSPTPHTHPVSFLFLNLSYFHFCYWRAWRLLLQSSTTFLWGEWLYPATQTYRLNCCSRCSLGTYTRTPANVAMSDTHMELPALPWLFRALLMLEWVSDLRFRSKLLPLRLWDPFVVEYPLCLLGSLCALIEDEFRFSWAF